MAVRLGMLGILRSSNDRTRLSTGLEFGGVFVDHERCTACGFDGSRYSDEALPAAVRDLGPTWKALLAESGTDLRTRPAPGVWSAIEYAAHSRDVTALHVFGVQQALAEDEPAYPPIDGDELIEVAAATYEAADPDRVGAELEVQASALADTAAEAGPAAWSRGLTIGGERSDVRRLLEHALHDSLHHVDDVQRGLLAIRVQSR